MPVELMSFLNLNPREKERAIRLFWRSVKKPDIDGCWVWTKKNPFKDDSLYGVFQFQSLGGQWFHMAAHRFSLAIIEGLDRDLEACHSCDNPPCVRPDHLWWGTHAENMADMALKGRGRRVPRFLEITDDIVSGANIEYDAAFSKKGRIGAMKAALFYGINRVIKHGSVERAFEIENKRLVKEIEKWKAKAIQVESPKSKNPPSLGGF